MISEKSNDRWSLARFGARNVKFNANGEWFRTKDCPSHYVLKYNDECNRMYSQLEIQMGIGGDKYQIALPRTLLLACLNVSLFGQIEAPRVGYPFTCSSCKEVISVEDFRIVLRRIEPVREHHRKSLIIFKDNIKHARDCIRAHERIRRDIIQEKTDKQFKGIVDSTLDIPLFEQRPPHNRR